MANDLYIGPAKPMHALINIMAEWKDKFHYNSKHEIIFQNKETFANVVLTNTVFHKIAGHARGFENIPNVIENPDEIWSLWENVKESGKKQQVVLRNYISFGKDGSYIVQTRDGMITDAFAVTNKIAEKYRTGVILIS